MHDTPPYITQKIQEMIRAKTPNERIEMGCSMYETSKQLIIRSILNDYPDISQAEMRSEFFLRFYGNDFDPVKRQKIINYFNQELGSSK